MFAYMCIVNEERSASDRDRVVARARDSEANLDRHVMAAWARRHNNDDQARR